MNLIPDKQRKVITLALVALGLIIVGCGDGTQKNDFIFCEENMDPPANEAYGSPDGDFRDPEVPPHETIEYRWRCVPADIAAEQGHSPNEGVLYLQIEQTWQLMDDGCWLELSESSREDQTC